MFELTEQAQNDIKEIWTYIADSNLNSADKAVEELFQKFQLLALNAELGKTRYEIFINLRGFPVKKYVVFYVSTTYGIEIYRVIHGSRNIDELFDDFFKNLDSMR